MDDYFNDGVCDANLSTSFLQAYVYLNILCTFFQLKNFGLTKEAFYELQEGCQISHAMICHYGTFFELQPGCRFYHSLMCYYGTLSKL